ncbi:hypothetical protein [Actinomadura geliboluensis]|uniref:hypothetical protein n=1 Tax=Actinomadura geliboluensis TaxID=882440 RepID=UPI00367A3502
MTAAPDFRASDADLLAMFAREFPGWRFARTSRGWWATRGPLTREGVKRGRDLSADTAEELYALLQAVPRRVRPHKGPGSGISI